jgi:hypothetical protein
MRVFTETQRFNQWWLQLINLSLLVFLLYALYQWFFVKEAVGNVMANDTTGQLVVLFSVVITPLMLFFIKLESAIDEIGVHYQFLPFHFSRKTIRWSEMDKCYTREYNPIREFGGWGLRGSFGKNKAYNIKGNKGIQIVLKTGDKVLIGTQKKTEPQQVIDRYFKPCNE